ncbi:carboxy-S-adenosyl-L-methionine synthase CmoA [Shigella flexneri]
MRLFRYYFHDWYVSRRFVAAGTQVYNWVVLWARRRLVRRNIHHDNCKIIAIDDSPAMIERCRRHIDAYKAPTPVDVIEGDIRDIAIENASMVVLNFTLQFLEPSERQALLDKIYQGLNPGGVLVFSEKFSFEDARLVNCCSTCTTTLNVPTVTANWKSARSTPCWKCDADHCVETHKARLKSRFEHCELWFQCFNFGSLLAVKAEDNRD